MALKADTAVVNSDTSLSPLSILRERTRDMHAHLETRVNLTSELASLATYSHLLVRYLNIYRQYEALLDQPENRLSNRVSPLYTSRVPLLEKDLSSLGFPENSRPSFHVSLDFPKLGNMDAVLGSLYVVEGSALGGQFIYRQIQQNLAIDYNSGAAFFYGNGARTGTCWKSFTNTLNRSIQQPSTAADAAEGMFRVFEQGLSSNVKQFRQHDS